MQYFITAIFITIRIFSISFSNLFQKELAHDNENPIVINFINYTILALFSIVLFLFIDKNLLGLNFWLFSIIGGIFGALGNYFMVEALKYGDLSVIAPINSYKAIIGLIFGFIILGEIPNLLGLSGIILILFGSYFIFNSLNIFKIFKRKDVQYRFLALIFSALEAIFIKKVILISSIELSFISTCILGFVFSYIIFKLNQNKDLVFKIKNKKHFLYYILTAICFGLMTYSTAFVFSRLQVGYSLSLFQLSILVNLFLGWKIFHETNIKRKLLGSIIIIIGAVLIFLQS